jgi:pimeloyl-ACP methyl ester carboxylesterase
MGKWTLPEQLRFFTALCLLGVLLAGCQSQTAIPTPDIYTGDGQPGVVDNWADDFKAEIEWFPCPFDANPETVKCGYLTVPADYSQYKNGQTVKLAFAQFKATSSEARDDALLLVAGYPLLREAGFVPYAFDELIKYQDIVVLDVRGVGMTEPLLSCPAMGTAAWEAVPTGGLTPEGWGKAYEECRQALESQKLNLPEYSFANMTHDLRALRIALKYPAWNLISIEPIGAYLAFEQLRSDPQGVRSLILDSVIPSYASTPSDYSAAQQAISDVFALCGQDEKCNAMFPDLETMFYQVVARLNKEPVEVEVFDLANGGRRATVLVNGNFLTGMVLNIISSGNTNDIGTIPRLIYQIDNGKLDVLKEMATNYLPGTDYSYPLLSFLALCRYQPMASENDVHTALSPLPAELAAFFQEDEQTNRAICNAWQPLPVDALPAPPTSLTPILLVQGQWAWQWSGAKSVEALTTAAPDAQVVKAPQSGMTTLFQNNTRICAQTMLVAFTANPEAAVDASCMPTESAITWITLR